MLAPAAFAIALLTSAILALAACGAADDAEPEPRVQEGTDCREPSPDDGAFDSSRACRDLVDQVRFGPRPAGSQANLRQVEMLRERLEGAGVQDVGVQGPWRNVVGRLPGAEPGAIVVGAHHDTKDGIEGFVGANDGASGVAVVLELARSLPRPFPGPEIRIALFDAEEARGTRPFTVDGMRGSRQYVELAEAGGRRGSAPLEEIRAMVLFDMVGDCDLEIPREMNSSPELYEPFEGEPFAGETTQAILDDHVPFRERGIPAVNIIDFQYGPGPPPGAWWHTVEDDLDKVCQESLDAVGEAALGALPLIADAAEAGRVAEGSAPE